MEYLSFFYYLLLSVKNKCAVGMQKKKKRTTICPCNTTSGQIHNENDNSKDTSTPLFTAVLFTIPQRGEQQKCPWTEKWIKTWYMHTMECYSRKDRDCVICSSEDGPGHCHTEFSMSETEKQVSYINTYTWKLGKWYRWSSLYTDEQTQT